MSIAQKPPIAYAPRGVVRKQIALRLLAPELAQHESLAKSAGSSSAALARQFYLRGLESYQNSAAAPKAAQRMNIPAGVNRA